MHCPCISLEAPTDVTKPSATNAKTGRPEQHFERLGNQRRRAFVMTSDMKDRAE
jgi:hypothetical protein